MNEKTNLAEVEKFFLALADKTRLRILNLMRDGEVCVGFLVESLNESQPKISRHLAYLRSAGVVETRRKGKRIFYKTAAHLDDFKFEVLRNTFLGIQLQKEIKTDYEKLNKISSASSELIELPDDLPSDVFADTFTKKKTSSHEMEVFLL